MRLAIILVHYHAAEWLARAVTALGTDLARSGRRAELVVVDNGSHAHERALIAQLPINVCVAGDNLGYAGGVNLGVAQTQAERLILMNPDVEVLPGCLSALQQALEGGAAAAGPRFYWERERKWLLPPTEERNRRSEIIRRLARRGGVWMQWAAWQWRQHARRHWLAGHPLRSFDLSGALLAVRRAAWQIVGPFDEGFKLYFEENDWLLRLKRRGFWACYVPAAEAVHFYNQSAAQEPAAALWMSESAARFERKHYGASFGVLLRALTPAAVNKPNFVPLPQGWPRLAWDWQISPKQWPLWMELSPSPLGFPAAAMLKEAPTSAGSSWRLANEIWEHLAPGTYYLRITDRLGRTLRRYSFERPVQKRLCS
jgi:GT2 family glycosyltransferase